MKTRTRFSAAIGALALTTASLFAAQPAQAADNISIPDEILKTCINSQLGQPYEAEITMDQALTVTQLSCSGRSRGIGSLQGLENFKNLEYLDVLRYSGSNFFMTLRNITPLSALTSLRVLRVPFNKITDLTPLRSLAQLTELNLEGNRGIDITPLNALPGLRSLNLTRTGISDAAPLAGMSQLETLNIRFNDISDATPFSGLTKLTKLDLLVNKVVDFSPLKPLVEAGIPVSVRWQYFDLPAIKINEIQANTVRDLDGKPVLPETTDNVVYHADDNNSWSYQKPKDNNQVYWEVNVPGFEAMGYFNQASLGWPSTLKDDAVSTDYQTPVTIDVLANDGQQGEPALDRTSLALAASGDGSVGSAIELVGYGMFDRVGDKIRFTPNVGFSGVVPSVSYRVTNADGVVSTATITVTVGAAPAIVTPPVVTPKPVQPTDNVTAVPKEIKTTAQETELANTGASPSTPLALAGLLLLAGIAAMLISRRRAN